MRDAKRIKPFLNFIEVEWETKIPDWRFGQFMSNFLSWVYAEKKIDPFFVEDDEMIKYLKEFLEIKNG